MKRRPLELICMHALNIKQGGKYEKDLATNYLIRRFLAHFLIGNKIIDAFY